MAETELSSESFQPAARVNLVQRIAPMLPAAAGFLSAQNLHERFHIGMHTLIDFASGQPLPRCSVTMLNPMQGFYQCFDNVINQATFRPESQVAIFLAGYTGEIVSGLFLAGLCARLFPRIAPILNAAAIGILTEMALSLTLDSQIHGSDLEIAAGYLSQLGLRIAPGMLYNLAYGLVGLSTSLLIWQRLRYHS